MGIANDISPKKQTKKADITKKDTKVEGENFEININNTPKYSDDPFVFDHHEEEETEEKQAEEEKTKEEKEYFGNHPKKTNNPMAKWVVFLIIILVFLLFYQNYSYFEGFFAGENNNETEENNSGSFYENDYTAETLDTTQENAPADAKSEETDTSILVTATIDRASQSISILNGNGVSGSADEVKTTLESSGFSISHVGNALKFSYVNTEIFYNIDKMAEAEDLKSTLTDRTCEIFENSSVAGNYDIVVVVGAK